MLVEEVHFSMIVPQTVSQIPFEVRFLIMVSYIESQMLSLFVKQSIILKMIVRLHRLVFLAMDLIPEQLLSVRSFDSPDCNTSTSASAAADFFLYTRTLTSAFNTVYSFCAAALNIYCVNWTRKCLYLLSMALSWFLVMVLPFKWQLLFSVLDPLPQQQCVIAPPMMPL